MSKTTSTTTTDAVPASLLSQFQGLGMFASPDVKPDTIDLAPGVTAAFYVRELPDAEFRALFNAGDRAKLIAVAICDADGKPVMTEKQAAQLKVQVAADMQAVVLKHAGFGEKASEAAAEAGNA